MEVMYRRDGEQNYMVWKAPEDLQGNEYQVRMLLVNEIPGLLRCRLRKINGEAYLYYEITSKQPLTRVFEHRAAGAEDIRALRCRSEKRWRGSQDICFRMTEWSWSRSLFIWIWRQRR